MGSATNVRCTSTPVVRPRGPAALVQRVGILERGSARKDASDVERAALRFKAEKTPTAAIDLLVEIADHDAKNLYVAMTRSSKRLDKNECAWRS